MQRVTLILWLALMNNAHAEPIHFAQLSKTPLQLEETGQVCHISAAFSPTIKHSLHLPWPCQFHLDKSGRPKIVRSGKFEYLLVESSTRQANSDDCDTQLRAVRAKGTTWQISPYQDRVSACPPFLWDAYVFSALFK